MSPGQHCSVVEHWPAHWRIIAWIPGEWQVPGLQVYSCPLSDGCGKQPINVSFSLSFSLPSSIILSLKINGKDMLGWGLTMRTTIKMTTITKKNTQRLWRVNKLNEILESSLNLEEKLRKGWVSSLWGLAIIILRTKLQLLELRCECSCEGEFYVSAWLNYGVPDIWLTIISVCVCEDVSSWDSHLNL